MQLKLILMFGIYPLILEIDDCKTFAFKPLGKTLIIYYLCLISMAAFHQPMY